MTTDRDDMPDDDAVLAAEYVLHLLPEDARRAAEERLAVDGAFRALVSDWSEDLAALADGVDPVDPPSSVREGLAAFVARGGASGAAGSSAGHASAQRTGLLGRLFGGTTGGLAAAAAAVVLLTVAVPMIEPPYSGPFFAGDLAASQPGVLRVSAFVDPRYHTLRLDLQEGGAPEGRQLQAWVIPEGSSTPQSLGLLEGDSTTIVVPDELAPLVKTGTLAISEEPPGGSPGDLPTGEILATGTVTET